MIAQASSEHSICIAVKTEFDEKAKKTLGDKFLNEISLGKLAPRIEKYGKYCNCG